MEKQEEYLDLILLEQKNTNKLLETLLNKEEEKVHILKALSFCVVPPFLISILLGLIYCVSKIN